nr:MAG TPA: Protein of unknown function (DUF3119) [Caudoviricetes sp.]
MKDWDHWRCWWPYFLRSTSFLRKYVFCMGPFHTVLTLSRRS